MVLCVARKSPLHAQFHQKVPLIVDYVDVTKILTFVRQTETTALVGVLAKKWDQDLESVLPT